jgi:N-methylhydantoinase A
MSKYKVGIDIGGTCTDFVVLDDVGNIYKHKVLSSIYVLDAVRKGLEELESIIPDLMSDAELIHGTTIATNTIVQKGGPKTGLLCTEGHRDTMYFRDSHRWDLFNLQLPHPDSFIPRYLCLPVRERLLYNGREFITLDEASVRRACADFKKWDVQAIAVCLLHSPSNPSHEKRVREILKEEMPGVLVDISSEVLPIIGEWQRSAATAFNVYVRGGFAGYLNDMEEYLRSAGMKLPLLIMQNNGGCATATEIVKRPINSLSSGPAAGPVAAIFWGDSEGERNLISVDMGGTSFDVSVITDRQINYTTDLKIADIPFGISSVDVHSIGAGGGSVAWLDRGGLLRVGPKSAGSNPGPACYSLGGEDPTITDANLVLGYLNPNYFLGGRFRIYPELAEKAIKEKVAQPLGIDTVSAASGIIKVVNQNMAAGVSVMTIERGIDPRKYVVVAGGGASPMHIGRLANILGINKVIIPREAAMFCAFGMCITDIRHDFVKAHYMDASDMDINELNKIYRDLEEEAIETLKGENVQLEYVEFRRWAYAKYKTQFYELPVPVLSGVLTEGDIPKLFDSFHSVHEERYAYSMRDSPVAFLDWRLTAICLRKKYNLSELICGSEDPTAAQKETRRVYFEEEEGFVEVPVYDGKQLRAGMIINEPSIIEEPTINVVVYPKQKLTISKYGYLILSNNKVSNMDTE